MKFNKIICAGVFIFGSLTENSWAQNSNGTSSYSGASTGDEAKPIEPETDMKPEDKSGEEAPPAEAPYPSARTEEKPDPIAPTAKPHSTPTPTTKTFPSAASGRAPPGAVPPLQKSREAPRNLKLETLRTPKPSPIPVEAQAPKVLGNPQSVHPSADAPLNIDRPKSIDDDGNYYYGKSNQKDETDVSKVPNAAPKSGDVPLKLSKPLRIKPNGEYFYGYEKSSHEHSASLKFGLFPAPNLKNKDNTDNTFKLLYSEKSVGTFLVDYEYQFHRKIGDFGIVLDPEFFTPADQEDSSTQRRTEIPAIVPDLNFNFVMFPNTVSGVYHFRYSEGQILTPYVGGGGGFFIFSEIRDDNQAPKFGGAAVALGFGGINIMIDGVEATAARELESTYGISHVSLNIEFTQFLGLHPTYDFTASVINAGFNFEF